MTDKKPWPGKPGLPLDPDLQGYHWLFYVGEKTTYAALWVPDTYEWELPGSRRERSANEMHDFLYLGPCRIPDEYLR